MQEEKMPLQTSMVQSYLGHGFDVTHFQQFLEYLKDKFSINFNDKLYNFWVDETIHNNTLKATEIRHMRINIILNRICKKSRKQLYVSLKFTSKKPDHDPTDGRFLKTILFITTTKMWNQQVRANGQYVVVNLIDKNSPSVFIMINEELVKFFFKI